MAKNVLKAWIADNTVIADDKTDKIFQLRESSVVLIVVWMRLPMPSISALRQGGAAGLIQHSEEWMSSCSWDDVHSTIRSINILFGADEDISGIKYTYY